ncbi:MAG: hypothetical protein HYR85_10500 [Planctomycetes bacterium]|nr:hypothetical protein [Planctomycetota bacterium]
MIPRALFPASLRPSTSPLESNARRPRAGIRSLGLALAILAGSTVARAGESDYTFAIGLAKRGYFDLGEQVLKDMAAKPNATPADKVLARLGQAGIMRQAAEKELDDKKKVDKLREAVKIYGDTIKGLEAANPQYWSAVFEYADCLQFIAQTIAEQIKDMTDKSQKKSLQSEGLQALDNAGKQLDAIADHFEKDRTTNPDSENQWKKAKYYRAINYYFQAQVYDRGSLERENTLKRGAEAIDNLLWDLDAETDPVAFYALIYKGKCLGERSLENSSKDDLRGAKTSFEGVTVLAEQEANLDHFQNLVEGAYDEYAKLLLEWKDYVGCDQFVKEMRKKFGKRPVQGPGWEAECSQADALHQLGKDEEALTVAKRVSEEAKGTTAGKHANEILAKLVKASGGAGGGSSEASLGVLISAARGLFDAGKYDEALTVYQQAAVKIEKPDDQKTHGGATWNAIGKCFVRLGRQQEAGIAFLEGAALYPEPKDRLVENSLAANDSLGAFAKLTGSEFDKAKAKEAHELAAKVSTGADFAYSTAKDQMSDGRFAEAYESFKKLDTTAGTKFDNSRFYMATAAFDEGQRLLTKEKNEAKANEWFAKIASDAKEYADAINDPKNPAADTTVADSRKQTQAAFVFFDAKGHAVKKEAAKVVETLKGFFDTYADQEQLVPSALLLETTALCDLGKMDDAEQLVTSLLPKLGNSTDLTKALGAIGEAHRTAAKPLGEAIKAAREKKAEPDPKQVAEWKDHLGKGADILSQWSKRPGANPTAVRLMQIGEMYQDTEQWEKAADVYADVLQRTKDDTRFDKRDALMLRYGQTLIALARTKPEKYAVAEAIYPEIYDTNCVQPGKPGPDGKKQLKVVPSIMLDYATVLGGALEVDKDGKVVHQDDGVKKYDKALELYGILATKLTNSSKFPDEWIEAKCGIAWMMYKQKSSEASTILTNFDRTNRALIDVSPVRAKFDYLKKLLFVPGSSDKKIEIKKSDKK